MKRTFMICLALVVVASLTAAAAGQRYTTTDDGRRIIANSASEVVAPAIRHDAKLKTLFSNLSDYEYGTYFCCAAYMVSGPDSMMGMVIWDAVPFTPKAKAKLAEVDVAVGSVSGTNSVAIWLAADASGSPGNMLAGPVDVDNLPAFGGCCTLAVAEFADVPLKKGTQYWIVVGTDSNSTGSEAAWAENSTDMRFLPFMQYWNGTWNAMSGVPPAIGIFGSK